MADLLFVLTWEGEIDMDLRVEVDSQSGGGWNGTYPVGVNLDGDTYYADEDDLGLPGGCCGNREEVSGLTTALSDDIIGSVTYYSWNTVETDAVFTLQVFMDGALYQEETGTITSADLLAGARLNVRWFELCSNAFVPAAAVGRIEMGGNPGGDSCLIPNDPAGPCWTYGVNWSSNTGSTYSDSGYGPGSYSPTGTQSQTFSSVSVTPPEQYWGCEDDYYAEVVMAAVSGLWADIITQIGTPADGACTTIGSADANFGWGGVRVVVNAVRTVTANGAFCRDYLPFGIADQVYIGIRFGSKGTTALVDWTGGGTVANAAAVPGADYGAAAQLGVADGRTFWIRGGSPGSTSDPIDDTYMISPSSSATVNVGDISDSIASGETQQGGA